jgi:hypothetical protein
MDRQSAASISVRPEVAAAFDTELQAALASTVWHSGCANWYVDDAGNDPNQWPWMWSTYRRRTSRVSPVTHRFTPAEPVTTELERVIVPIQT